MWRGIGLVAIVVVAAVAIACGGGGDSDEGVAAPCNLETAEAAVATRSARERPTYSLDEALEAVDWLRVPSEMPLDAKLGPVRVFESGTCRSDVYQANIWYEGPGYTVALEECYCESSGGTGRPTPFKVNGVTGGFSSRENVERIVWKKGNVEFTAIARLGGDLDHARFLEIVESIPD